MHATYLKSQVVLFLLLSSLAVTPGCSGLFGSGSSDNLDNNCTKDIDVLNGLLGSPQTCTTTAECPVGAFCNLETSSCDFDCYADSDCGMGMGCTCEGQCALDSGLDAGPVDPNNDPSCPRSTTLLESIHTPPTVCAIDTDCPAGAVCDLGSLTCKSLTPRACTFDDECPWGARCDSGTLTCIWDCLSSDDLTFGCPVDTVCDCYGNCVDPLDNAPRDSAQLPRLALSPPNIPLTSATGWGARRINIALITTVEAVGTASTGTVVHVTAGEGLEVTCGELARDTGPYTSSCIVNTWSFVDGNGAFDGSADHFVWVRPVNPPPLVTSWQVQVSSDGAANSPEIISIDLPPPPPLVDPFQQDGEYTGYVELVRAGMLSPTLRTPIHAADSVPLRVPVQAWVTNGSDGFIDFVDDFGIISQNGKLRLAINGRETVTHFVTPVDQGNSIPPDADGELGVHTNNLTPPVPDSQAATLSGEYRSGSSGQVYLHWRFQLVRVADRTACASDADCSAGTLCDFDIGLDPLDPTMGACTGGAPWDGVFDPLVALDHKKSERWDAAIDGLLSSIMQVPLEGLPFMDLPRQWHLQLYLPESFYEGLLGVSSPTIETHRQIIGADTFAASSEPLVRPFANYDFYQYIVWIENSSSLLPRCFNGTSERSCILMSGAPFFIDEWYITAGVYQSDYTSNHIPCVDPNPINLDATGKLAGIPSDFSASCEALFSNYSQKNAPLPSGNTLGTFLSNECHLTDDELWFEVSGDPVLDRHRVYLCPYKEPILGPLNPATLAERMLCYEPDPNTLLLETARLGQDVLATSGDLACSDGRIPTGVDLVTHTDRVAAGEATPVGAADMLVRCLDDLSAEHSPLLTIFDLATAPPHFENLFSHDACFSAANFYGAFAAVTSGNWVQADLEGDPRIPTLYMRLLQQWLELHSYVAKQGQEQQGLADVLASRSDLDVNEADAVSQAPGFEALLDQMEKGWNLVLSRENSDRLFAIPSATLLAPDYRTAFLGTPPASQPHHEQGVGLPVSIIETASLHLQLLDAYLQDALNRSYADCFFGIPSAAQAASDRAARTMRYVLTAESIASTVRDGATAVVCGGGCDPGLICNVDGYCELSDGTWQRAPHSWSDRWDSSFIEYQSIRARVAGTMRALASCVNPLDVAENQVPIYFGDPVGNTNRFFASSDYLLNGWAIPATQGAEFSLTEARTSWLSKRNSEIQQTQTQQDADRRLEGVSAQYGRTIVDACGLVNVEAKDALALVADGTISPDSCYFNPQNDPSCERPLQPLLQSTVSNEIAQFQLCMWNHVAENLNGPPTITFGFIEIPVRVPQYLALLSALEQLGDAPANYVGASVAENPPASSLYEVSAGSVIFPVSHLFDIAAIAADALPDAVADARSFCANEALGPPLDYFQGVEHSLPEDTQSLTDITSVAHCYQGQLGEGAMGVLIGAKEIEIALARWEELSNRIENEATYCINRQALVEARNALSAIHTDYMTQQVEAKRRAQNSGIELGILAKWIVAVAGVVAAPFTGGASLSLTAAVVASWVQDVATEPSRKNVVGIAAAMETSSLNFQHALLLIQGQMQVTDCFHGLKQLREGIHTAALQIEQSSLAADLKLVQFLNAYRAVTQAFLEGRAAVAREAGRVVPSIAHHYWLSEKIDRFQKDFKWAKQLVFLAMKAVEYEFQQTLSVREDIVTAVHPGQLEDAVRVLQQEQLTRTINSRRPDEATLVLSLRDQIMRVADNSSNDPGERDWSPDVRFQRRLWSDDYAVRDNEGTYLGQGIPFTVVPVGPLPYRCAERLWSMTATIQGDLLGNRAPGAPVFIVRRNQFASQWCDGRGDDNTYQVASLQPASQLFHPENRGGSEAAQLSHITAMLYPWFNIPRSEFYREAYVEGASDELAGRGLYGDYILLFPWHGLLEDGFPLEQIEDVLVRFDYLSVDNLTGL